MYLPIICYTSTEKARWHVPNGRGLMGINGRKSRSRKLPRKWKVLYPYHMRRTENPQSCLPKPFKLKHRGLHTEQKMPPDESRIKGPCKVSKTLNYKPRGSLGASALSPTMAGQTERAPWDKDVAALEHQTRLSGRGKGCPSKRDRNPKITET